MSLALHQCMCVDVPPSHERYQGAPDVPGVVWRQPMVAGVPGGAAQSLLPSIANCTVCNCCKEAGGVRSRVGSVCPARGGRGRGRQVKRGRGAVGRCVWAGRGHAGHHNAATGMQRGGLAAWRRCGRGSSKHMGARTFAEAACGWVHQRAGHAHHPPWLHHGWWVMVAGGGGRRRAPEFRSVAGGPARDGLSSGVHAHAGARMHSW